MEADTQVGLSLLINYFVILFKDNQQNNQKDFTVSHLTAQDKRKPLSYSAVNLMKELLLHRNNYVVLPKV